jgi:hypothetical protein
MIYMKIALSLAVSLPILFWYVFLWFTPISRGIGVVDHEMLSAVRAGLVFSLVLVLAAMIWACLLNKKKVLSGKFSFLLLCLGSGFLYWAIPLVFGFV